MTHGRVTGLVLSRSQNLKSSQEEVKISKKKITELQLELACSKRGTEVAAVQQIQFDAKIQVGFD